jgi:hypothetical protein
VSLLGVEVTWLTLENYLLRTGAAAAALAVCVKFLIIPVVRFFQRMERAITNVEEQLYPNGGHSLRDAVSQIQAHLGLAALLPENTPNHPPHHRLSTPDET